MKRKIRLDCYLVEKGGIPSRSRAQALILGGYVLVNGVKCTKCGADIPKDAVVEIRGNDHPFVGRGGIKLAKALDEFAVEVSGKCCLDAGASTGGFTDCLLQRGARRVYAVDVGYGQLAWKLQKDSRVVCLDRTNLRRIDPSLIKQPVELITLDLAFISLRKIFPILPVLMAAAAKVIALIKPQFEVGRSRVGKGGIVREESFRADAVEKVVIAARSQGWEHCGTIESPITGAEGNVEYLALFQS